MPAVSETMILDAVSPGYFDVVGVEPGIGRMLQPDDHARGAAVLVLAHSTWRSRFNADPGVIGTVVRIGAEVVRGRGRGPLVVPWLPDRRSGDAGRWYIDEAARGWPPPRVASTTAIGAT